MNQVKQKPILTVGQLSSDKIQPSSVEIERFLVGTMILYPNCIEYAMNHLHSSMFYDQTVAIVYKSIIGLYKNNMKVDMLTVIERLKSKDKLSNIGGPGYIIDLTQNIGLSTNFETHCDIVIESFLLREIIYTARESVQAAQSLDDSEIIIKRTIDKLQHLLQYKPVSKLESAKSIAESQSEIATNDIPFKGISTKIPSLDNRWMYLQKGDLIILAARPSVGKTALILQIAKNVAEQKIPVLFCSLEMTKEKLVQRLISAITEIPVKRIVTKELSNTEKELIKNSKDSIPSELIFYDQLLSLAILERLIVKYLPELLIIDYLQLMIPGMNEKVQRNREQDISEISRNLKALAKKYNITIIPLSQLSRNVETRGGDKRPRLSDLRESGAIEQDADIVSFIYRPGYHDIKTPVEGLTEIITSKNRNSEIGIDMLKFNGASMSFSEIDETENQIIESTDKLNQEEEPF